MIFVLVFSYVLVTPPAWYLARRYAVLRPGFRLAYVLTLAPAMIAGSVLVMMVFDACFDLAGAIDAAEATDEAIETAYPTISILMEVAGWPLQISPFVFLGTFGTGAVLAIPTWYWLFRALDRPTPEERRALVRSIEEREAEEREVERRFARKRAELDAVIRGPRGAECPRCQKKLTFFNSAHGENLRICSTCYRELAHLGSAGPIRRQIREEVRAERRRISTAR